MASMMLLCGVLSLLLLQPAQGFVANFSTNHTLNKLAVDTVSGMVYVGATNSLYQLDSSLKLNDSDVTGPVMDNPRCFSVTESSTCILGSKDIDKKLTDNVNKVLAIDRRNSQLVTCGSIYQGSCQVRKLNDITTFQRYNDYEKFRIAANNATMSTVAFVALGTTDIGESDVFYVATTYTGNSAETHPLRRGTPAVSSRALVGNTLDYAFKNSLTGKSSKIYLNAEYRKNHIVDYVTGFSVDDFSYFLTVQHADTSTDSYVSKIIQICHSDKYYTSYVEMPITCGDYNLLQAATVVSTPGSSLQATGAVVLATFSQSEPNSKMPTSRSAICVYTLSDIRQRFTDNLKYCYDGQGVYGEQFGSEVCKKRTWFLDPDYCNLPSVIKNKPLVGALSLDRSPVFQTTASRLSAIAATVARNIYTVAFLGTSHGHVIKVLIFTVSGTVIGEEFENITITSGEPVNSDLLFDHSQTHLYAMTTHLVVKMPVQECDKLRTCQDCHRDPFCGWCLLENKCSTKANCSQSDVSRRWQSYSESAACAGITSVTPTNSSLTSPAEVTLTVPNLPTVSKSYTCLFGDIETSATVTGDTVICQPPTADAITKQPHNRTWDHVPMKLSLRSSETKVSFLQTDFNFYNCSTHESCISCTSALWGCNWCIHENKCTKKDSCDARDISVHSNHSCPHLQDNTKEILLPAEFEKEISLHGANLPEPRAGDKGYECLLHLTTPPLRVDAIRVNSASVKCKATKYSYTSSVSSRTVQLQVVWNDNHLIDDMAKTTVTVYKCSELGPDCSRCLTLDLRENAAMNKFKCVWCSTALCTYQSQCQHKTDKCKKPTITMVTPLTGPLEGGTLVTITGTNLGYNFKQVKDAVTIGGRPCNVIEDKYKVSLQIVCQTVRVDNPMNGSVVVAIDQSSTPYAQQFSYQNPKVTSFSPTVGPKSGGTRLTIQGQQLNTGASLTVLLGDTHCNVIGPVVSTLIHCVTSPVHTPRHTSVRVKFDDTIRSLNAVFNFTEDPNITRIHPLTTFHAGGRTVTVEGAYFSSVQQPQMFVKVDDRKSNLTNCDLVSAGLMKCPFPAVTTDHRERRSTATSAPSVGFVMDGVASVGNLSSYFPDLDGNINVVANPVYNKFKSGRKVYKGEALLLQGSNLSGASDPSDVEVTIGNSKCKVKSLNPDSLLCTPPDTQPPGVTAGREDPNKLPQVVVRVGNLKYELGELEYQQPVNQRNELWIIGVALGGGVLITIIIIILVIYKRKSTYAERQFKKMQIQLDTLESNVRNECKQAFAELQTEVSDFTSDLNAKGVPFWDFRTYTFKVLFPSYNDHPILHSTPPSVTTTFGGTDQALGQFNQLLNSKQFLLIFIRTLEEQNNFMIRDKALVASLLMVVLQDKMEYATDILKALLNELIDRSVERKNPKLMFRRTESVVEKLLTNWMSLCMYDYLKKHAGKTMFMLYKSIKHQTEKGPVDAITSEAKYSLSEDRLLREKIDFNTLMVELTTETCREPVMCKVLDCDTITQAKEKSLDAIYRNTPFSVRPSIYDVELEWRSGRSGHLPLQDEDVTTEVKHKMKRVNNLAHYHIPDHSQMTLVRKHDNNEGVRKVHGRLEITSGSTLNAVVEVEDGVKVWHLVKHDDNSNSSHGPKVISEIFLTRLLATKGTLQQYIDDLFMTILRADCTLPPAVKHLFDFLDNAIKRHNIVDPEVIHTWKSNSLPLRFWVNIIKNPEFVFDIHKSNIVDSCLSVIAQTFMDSCSTVEHRLGKDSPSNKLLFAKDIPRYRQWVAQFYRNIQEMPQVTDQVMSTAMMELSMNNRLDFNVSVALRELFQYAKQYSFELLEALDNDSSGKKLRLAARFEEVLITSGEPPDY